MLNSLLLARHGGTPERDESVAEYELSHCIGTSSFVSLVALEETGACFDVVMGTVDDEFPVLRAPRGVIQENIAILVYLALRHARSHLLPSFNKYSHASAISWMLRMSGSLEPSIRRLQYSRRPSDLHMIHERLVIQAKNDIVAEFYNWESALSAQPWLLGKAWSIADVYLYWCFKSATDFGVETNAFLRLSEHASRVLQRPSVKIALQVDSLAGGGFSNVEEDLKVEETAPEVVALSIDWK